MNNGFIVYDILFLLFLLFALKFTIFKIKIVMSIIVFNTNNKRKRKI